MPKKTYDTTVKILNEHGKVSESVRSIYKIKRGKIKIIKEERIKMKKIFRVGLEKNYKECQILPSIRFWHYEGHVGIQLEWIHWAGWIVIGKNN